MSNGYRRYVPSPLILFFLSWLVGVIGSGAETSYPSISEPVRLTDDNAFSNSRTAALSRAAAVLVVGDLMCIANKEEFCDAPAKSVAPPEDLAQLGLKVNLLELAEKEPQRFSLGELREQLAELRDPASAQLAESEQALRLQSHALSQLQGAPTRKNAATLSYAALNDPDMLVQIAGACALSHVLPNSSPAQEVIMKLDAGARESDELRRDVAATCLARLQPKYDWPQNLVAQPPDWGDGPPAHTSLVVHGTWAAKGGWWHPGGDFYNYLAPLVHDLYSDPDTFFWSGKWDGAERELAAQQLLYWASKKNAQCLNVFAHSHGGNIIFLASRINRPTLAFGRTVLLSVPVHPRYYVPDFSRFQSLIAIRVHLDLVVLADGGGQSFPESNISIEEKVLPIWYNHSASHSPDTWKLYNLMAGLSSKLCPPPSK